MDARQKKILCFSAHPDDEIGGAGGFLLKARAQGAAVQLALACDGASQKGERSAAKERRIRLKEFEEVGRRLGATTTFLDFPRYFSFDLSKTILSCVEVIRKFRPDIVLVPHRDERHAEHAALYRIVREACWIAKGKRFSEQGNPWEIKELREYELDAPLTIVTDLEDITYFADAKEELFKVYASQLANKDHLEAMRGLSKYRAIVGRCGRFAEAFRTTRQLVFPS